MPEFQSSAVRRAEYDPRTKVLTLWLAGGGPYHYVEVPIIVYEGLCRAASKGAFFNARIKDVYEVRSLKAG